MRRGVIPGGSGSVRPLTVLGDPVLHAPCTPVTDFGPALAALAEDMFATMYAARGVGLAANQIGVPLRVFVYDCPDDDDRRRLGLVVNPRLTVSGDPLTGPEGCLSLPGLEARTDRSEFARVTGLDLHGKPLEIDGSGFFARCLQHECDHLAGTVYADRLGPLRRRRLLRAARRTEWGRTPAVPAEAARAAGG